MSTRLFFYFFAVVVYSIVSCSCIWANEILALGISENISDNKAVVDIGAYENAIRCRYSDNYPDVLYNSSVVLLRPDEKMQRLVQEYMELVSKVKMEKELLDMPFDETDWLPTDAADLYQNLESDTERKYVLSSVRDRQLGSESSELINIGLNIAAMTVAGKFGDAKNNTEYDMSVKPIEPDNNIDNTESNISKTIQEEITQDSIAGLCEEFPEEPECSGQ